MGAPRERATMLQLIDKIGLKRTLYATFIAALVLFVLLTGFVVNRIVRQEFEDGLRQRAESDARTTAALIAAPLSAGRDSEVLAALDGGLHDSDDAYLVVLRPDRSA